jgi:hypothetical protein
MKAATHVMRAIRLGAEPCGVGMLDSDSPDFLDVFDVFAVRLFGSA